MDNLQEESVDWYLVERKSKKHIPISIQNYTVGRSLESNLSIADVQVSRNHAVIHVEGSKLFVEDLNSANGTYINKVRLPPNTRVQINENDSLIFGNPYTNFFFEYKISKHLDDIIEIESDEENDVNALTEPSISVKNEIKCEPEEVVESKSQTPCLGFSAAIECIEISDDEDNQETEFSRLTNLFNQIQTKTALQTIKREPTELEMDPKILDIKMELHDLDYQADNILNAVPIDIDDNYEEYDLLNILEDRNDEQDEIEQSNEQNDESNNIGNSVKDFVFDLSEFENKAQNIEKIYKDIEDKYQNVESKYLNHDVHEKSDNLQQSSNCNIDTNNKNLNNEIRYYNKTDKDKLNDIIDGKDEQKVHHNEKIKEADEIDDDEGALISEASEAEATFSDENESPSDSYSDNETKENEIKKDLTTESFTNVDNKLTKHDMKKSDTLTNDFLPNSSKSKYVKPPIIPPHTEPFLKRRRGYVDPSLDEKAKELKSNLTKVLKRTKFGLSLEERENNKKRRERKRKAVVQCEAATKKTKSQTHADIKKEMSRRNMSTEVSSNTKINEKHKIAKEKLKVKKEKPEDDVKEKVEKPIKEKQTKPIKAKVKVSENRGMYLTENQPGPSTSTSRRKSVDENLDQTMQNSFKELELKRQAFRAPGQRSQMQQQENVDEIVSIIIKWSVKWFVEQAQLTKSPPVNDNKDPKKLTQTFDCFDDYKNTMSGLTMLELWTDIYQSFEREYASRELLKAVVKHDKVCGVGLYLDCECYITESQFKANNVPKTHDFIICALPYVEKSASKMQLTVGLVTRCCRIPMDDKTILCDNLLKMRNHDNETPFFRLHFNIVTRYSPDKPIRTDFIALKIVDNIEKHFHLFRTIKRLRLSQLINMVLRPSLSDYKVPPVSIRLSEQAESLNAQQKQIVMEAATVALSINPGFYLIMGPPGTGKSTVIVHTIFEILLNKLDKGCKNESKILVVAPSNAAIDDLTRKILKFRSTLPDIVKRHIKLLRTGPEQSIGQNVEQSKLSYLAFHHLMLQYKHRLDGIEAKDNIERLQIFLGKHRYRRELREAEDSLLLGCTIICTTLGSSCNSRIFEPVKKRLIKFSCCIVDEATQCTEVEALCPIQLNIEKFVLVGDPKQLPATVQNMDARDLGFEQPLFSRIYENIGNDAESPIRMLDTQYRMHQEICAFPNRYFYNNRLKSAPKYTNKIKPSIQPFLLFNVIKSHETEGNNNYVNKTELFIIEQLLEILHLKIKNCSYSIGIITPYNNQKDLINKALNKVSYKEMDITVNTVDGFQGQERDIIIISCVRKDPNNFVENDNRLNVALTRARQALYIIGNYTLFKQTKTLYEIREDCKKRRRCVDIADLSEKTVAKLLKQWIFVQDN